MIGRMYSQRWNYNIQYNSRFLFFLHLRSTSKLPSCFQTLSRTSLHHVRYKLKHRILRPWWSVFSSNTRVTVHHPSLRTLSPWSGAASPLLIHCTRWSGKRRVRSIVIWSQDFTLPSLVKLREVIQHERTKTPAFRIVENIFPKGRYGLGYRWTGVNWRWNSICSLIVSRVKQSFG